MKYLKTFEGHSIKKSKISKEELSQILQKVNLVTLPFFDDESALLHHIKNNFDDSDAAMVMNPSKDLTSVTQDGTTAMLYTKKKTYVIEEISDMEFEDYSNPGSEQGGIPQ